MKCCATEVYFWCFSSSEWYILCLIKYVFWLAVLASVLSAGAERRERARTAEEGDARGPPFDFPICLSNMNHQTGCGSSSLKGRQSSQLEAPRLDSQAVYFQSVALYWYKLLFKDDWDVRRGGGGQMFPLQQGVLSFSPVL